MRSRGFNKRVEIWETTPSQNIYGGNTVTETLLSTSWANIKTLAAKIGDLETQFGILDASNSIELTMRKRESITYNLQTMYIKYRGEKYIIKSYPSNVNFDDSNIKIICTKESNIG